MPVRLESLAVLYGAVGRVSQIVEGIQGGQASAPWQMDIL